MENEEIEFNPLGKGIITSIDRQKTLTSGKYNLIIEVDFEIGQSCKFSKLLDIEKNNAEKYFDLSHTHLQVAQKANAESKTCKRVCLEKLG